MGRLSNAIFKRAKLPDKCLIYAGAYIPERKDWVKNLFSEWQRVTGHWIRYSYAYRQGKEFLIIFNVYGAAMILEILQLLKEGETKQVFFIGSLGGKDLPVGTLVLPNKIIDKTGFVSVDEPDKRTVKPKQDCLERLRNTIKELGEDYVEGPIVSVPCVLHNIDTIKEFVEQDPKILGVEMETSTFYHYSQKELLESYVLLYVSDNKRHDIINKANNVKQARKQSLRRITRIATKLMHSS